MKTKLLKKIRKRFTITKVHQLASNACPTYKAAEEEFGLPFFVLTDKEDAFGLFTRFYGTYEESVEKLNVWIISSYGEKFRHKDSKESKVWW